MGTDCLINHISVGMIVGPLRSGHTSLTEQSLPYWRLIFTHLLQGVVSPTAQRRCCLQRQVRMVLPWNSKPSCQVLTCSGRSLGFLTSSNGIPENRKWNEDEFLKAWRRSGAENSTSSAFLVSSKSSSLAVLQPFSQSALNASHTSSTRSTHPKTWQNHCTLAF